MNTQNSVHLLPAFAEHGAVPPPPSLSVTSGARPVDPAGTARPVATAASAARSCCEERGRAEWGVSLRFFASWYRQPKGSSPKPTASLQDGDSKFSTKGVCCRWTSSRLEDHLKVQSPRAPGPHPQKLVRPEWQASPDTRQNRTFGGLQEPQP